MFCFFMFIRHNINLFYYYFIIILNKVVILTAHMKSITINSNKLLTLMYIQQSFPTLQKYIITYVNTLWFVKLTPCGVKNLWKAKDFTHTFDTTWENHHINKSKTPWKSYLADDESEIIPTEYHRQQFKYLYAFVSSFTS